MNDWNSLKSLCQALKEPNALIKATEACKNSNSFTDLNSHRVIHTVLHEQKPTFFQTKGAGKTEQFFIALGTEQLKALEKIETNLESSANML